MIERSYDLNIKLTNEEITAYRKGQHQVEAKSMSAFVRECVMIRLVELELVPVTKVSNAQSS